jgi:hypothetical protein
MQEVYQRVAKAFAEEILKMFVSEESLEKAFHRIFSVLPFSRTDHWGAVLGRKLTDVWFEKGPEVRSVQTPYDQEQILDHLYGLLDYNLYTQVLMNLQKYLGFAYNTAEAKKQLDSLEAFYKDKEKSPFVSKATMVKNATRFDDLRYNNDLSALKALRMIEKFGMANSWRVSPTGSTPAFADSLNVSMIGAGGDKYLVTIPGTRVYFISWPATPGIIIPQEDGSFKTPGIDYSFISKSGGEILNEVLFSRWVTSHVYGAVRTANVKVLIPRMKSVQIVTDFFNTNDEFHNLTSRFTNCPFLTFSCDERPQN